MASLPSDFRFSQARFQDLVDCPKRFELRYLQRQPWPAIEAEPIEAHEKRRRQGTLFHQMVHQHLTGIDAETVGHVGGGDDLKRWWASYRRAAPAPAGERFPEVTLVGEVAGYPLVATYDLVVVRPDGRVSIVDWKTSRRRPHRDELAARLQTRVYPYLLAQAGADLTDGTEIEPESVEMMYWYAEHPEVPITFQYSSFQYEEDARYLKGLAREVLQRESFEETTEHRHCRYCTYRSLCARGVSAADLSAGAASSDLEDSERLEINFDEIEEVAL